MVINDEIRMARIKQGDMTIQHAFHQIPGGEPFMKRISSLNLDRNEISSNFNRWLNREPSFSGA